MFLSQFKSPWSAGLAIAAILAGTGAGAASIHRLAVSSSTGSGGATTYLQSSASGGALQGENAASANTTVRIPFGILGEYDNGTAFGVGTLGISTTGYGVGAETLSAKQPSLIALNSSGGPAAQLYGKNGGLGADIEASGGGVGVYALSDSSNAIAAYSKTSQYAAVYGEDDSSTAAAYGIAGNSFSPGGFGTYGYSAYGAGLTGESESGSQGLPSIQAISFTDGTELFEAGVSDLNTGNSYSASTVLSSVSNDVSGEVIMGGVASSDLQINGDIFITGAIFTDCDGSVPYATDNCGGNETLVKERAPGGASYDMYSSVHASKTLEDEGEATLRNGVAHVNLDPAFTAVISARQPYLVFTTPQGDTRGLYVTNRNARGFDVRETGNGHNSLTFDYRIVAHPAGAESKRMALSQRKTRLAGTRGRPAPSRALVAHNALLAHARLQHAKHTGFPAKKMPASLVSLH